jgi:two-component system nitrogen regulation response regulator GlnG
MTRILSPTPTRARSITLPAAAPATPRTRPISLAEPRADAPERALIVDDDREICHLLGVLLRRNGFEVDAVHDGKAALKRLRSEPPDVMLLDVKMSGCDGMEVLRRVRGDHPLLPVVMMTAYAGVGQAVEAIRTGAVNYIPKPFDNTQVVPLVRQAMADRRQGPADCGCTDDLCQWLTRTMGPSAAVAHLVDQLASVVGTDFSIVVQGETGTGKELVARTIHRFSPRSKGPFVAVDCGALPDNLLENELFGHERGAYTGADRREIGKLEAADGGTLFLDEIGNMPLKSQAALLRALQERTIYRVGGHEPIAIDVRVVVASNENFMQAVERGDFREDLWYRLNEFQLRLPPLRERQDDILHLAELFLKQTAAELKRPLPTLSASARHLLLTFDWPGNVRELRSVVRRACLVDKPEIEADDIGLRSRARREIDGFIESRELTLGETSLREIVNDNLARLERVVLVKALRQTKGNKAEAARLLKVDYKTIYNKLKKFEINPAEIAYERQAT